jgi:subtilisin family serine protease
VASIGAAAWYATVEWADNPADPFGLFRNPDGSPRCNPACAEDFSSAGGVPLHFDAIGNRLATAVVPENPWVTGPDGGNTTFFTSDSSFDDDDGDGLNNPFSAFLTPIDPDPGSEYPNFFGTSASAPHVAAVAGIMLEKNPGLTRPQLLGILRDTAEDMSLRFVNVATESGPATIVFPVGDPDPAGFDFDTGHGFVDAEAALDATPPDGG